MTHADLALMSPLDALICGAVYFWFNANGLHRLHLHDDSEALRRIAPSKVDIPHCLERLVALGVLTHHATPDGSYYTLPE